MNVGILVPGSKAHPELMPDFMNAFKSCLRVNHCDTSIQIISEYIGYGGKEKEVYERAEKLLLIDEVDVLIGYLDFRVLPILQPLLYTTGKLMIVVNSGANHPENWVAPDNVIYLTLQHSFLCWLGGQSAIERGASQAVMASSFYDCGYFHTATMVRSFTDRGGSIAFNYINNQAHSKEFDIHSLTEFLSANNEVQDIFCVFDTFPAQLFYGQLNSFKGASKLHLFVSPMMLECDALSISNQKYQFAIEGYSPWLPANDNPINLAFTSNYNQQFGKDPSVFSLQGWETALILLKVLHLKPAGLEGSHICSCLENDPIAGPRGALVLDRETHFYLAPVYKLLINPMESTPRFTYTDFPRGLWEDYYKQVYEGVSSGWTNTYLCY
jgi:hypothetical protein